MKNIIVLLSILTLSSCISRQKNSTFGNREPQSEDCPMCSFWTGSSKALSLQVDRNSVYSEPFESICSEEGNAKKFLQVSNDWKALSYKNYMNGMVECGREFGVDLREEFTISMVV